MISSSKEKGGESLVRGVSVIQWVWTVPGRKINTKKLYLNV